MTVCDQDGRLLAAVVSAVLLFHRMRGKADTVDAIPCAGLHRRRSGILGQPHVCAPVAQRLAHVI